VKGRLPAVGRPSSPYPVCGLGREVYLLLSESQQELGVDSRPPVRREVGHPRDQPVHLADQPGGECGFELVKRLAYFGLHARYVPFEVFGK